MKKGLIFMSKTFYEALLGIEIPNEMGIYEESGELSPAAQNYVDKVLHLAKEMNINIIYDHGVSQLAFIIEETNEVIKVGFDGMIEEWDEWNEDEGDYIWHEEYSPFDIDYCSKAYEIYNLASEAGLENLFAKMDILGVNFNNQTIWTQTYVTSISDGGKSSTKPSKNSLDKAKEISQKIHVPFQSEWCAAVIENYGIEIFNQLLSFINEQNICDLHTGNYGYTREGLPCILDYSSWG